MWYHGNENVPAHAAIGYATSPDGITWTKYEGNPVLTIEGVSSWANELFHPSVVYSSTGEYRMWYGALGQAPPIVSEIGYATAPSVVADEPAGAPPTATLLRPPHPNPTTGAVSLSYTLTEAAPTTLTVYDLLGREVARLVDGERPAGAGTAVWDGRGPAGRPVPAGLYFVRFRTPTEAHTRPVTVLR
jgi:hypothetical protein